MSPALRVQDLPLSWYDRPEYKPRVELEGREAWFLLAAAFAPPESVPGAPPREPACGREALRRAFEETYARWGVPRTAATERSLAEVAAPGTAVAVTGQQPGFLGGPLHTFYKAVTAVAAARRHRALAGRPCVPVFWVAGEDHDLDEVREARFPAGDAGEACFRYPHPQDRRPLSEYPADAAALEVLGAAAEHFARRRHGEEARALIDLYRGRTLAGGFAALVAALLGETGLLVLDPETVRPLAREVFRAALESPEEVVALIERGRAEVEAKGLKPFVAARLPLFVLRGERRDHLSPAPGGLQVDGGGPLLERRECLELLERDPRAFSTGALLRPIVQELCLPVAVAAGGPAEVGYFAQLGPLAARFGLPRPRIALRLNGTVLDGKLAARAQEIPLEALAAARAPEDLVWSDEGRAGEARPDPALAGLAGEVEARLRRAIDALPPSAEAARLARRAGELRQELERLVDKASRLSSAAGAEALEGARKLWGAVFPGGELQERRWGVLHLVAKHGTGWIEELLRAEEPDPLRVRHRLLVFED
ncbi:MAG: bacillithiol biosynthesis BshC [Planctomycetes bacterium]|nr:bacillithiol biosynthesis BshC [Planctomycetota bacterium]